jgi:quercetin dioxygenase-like cupin family protein
LLITGDIWQGIKEGTLMAVAMRSTAHDAATNDRRQPRSESPRGYHMKHRIALVIVALLLTLGMAPAVAAADPPANTVRHQFRTDGLPVPGPAEVIKFVLDFAPGAATPLLTHPGLVIATVLEGALTSSHGGTDKVYGVGDSFTEVPGQTYLARNLTAGHTRVMASIVAPKGADPATVVPGGPTPAPPGPAMLYLFRADATIPTGAYEVAHTVLDFVPGAQTPPHTHPGQVFVTVLEGVQTFRTGGAEKVYGVGESFVEQPGVVGQAVNMSGTNVTVLATYFLPKGAALSAPVAAPATVASATTPPAASAPGAPRTGGGGEAFFIRRLGDG